MSKKKRMKNRMTRAERQQLMCKRRRKRIALLVTEVLILAALCVTAYGIFKLDKLDFNILNDKNLEAYKDTGPYTNIALFGLNYINNDTSDVTLTSIYRDTLLQQKDGTYEKANSAYNRGGPEEAISLLNRNFDLDIHNYVSVNFTALVNTIDLLGGLELDMTAEEADWCNKYAVETAEVAGKDWEDIEVKDGTQKVDGVHAVAYARIRYTEGMDFKRTERQRIVLEKTAEKAKKANLLTLNKMIDEIFPMISTSFSTQDLLGFAANALNYNIVQTGGFPYQVTTREDVRNHEGSYVVPIGFANNVTQLHQESLRREVLPQKP